MRFKLYFALINIIRQNLKCRLNDFRRIIWFIQISFYRFDQNRAEAGIIQWHYPIRHEIHPFFINFLPFPYDLTFIFHFGCCSPISFYAFFDFRPPCFSRHSVKHFIQCLKCHIDQCRPIYDVAKHMTSTHLLYGCHIIEFDSSSLMEFLYIFPQTHRQLYTECLFYADCNIQTICICQFRIIVQSAKIVI